MDGPPFSASVLLMPSITKETRHAIEIFYHLVDRRECSGERLGGYSDKNATIVDIFPLVSVIEKLYHHGKRQGERYWVEEVHHDLL
jgi:hypothetical protein